MSMKQAKRAHTFQPCCKGKEHAAQFGAAFRAMLQDVAQRREDQDARHCCTCW
jgi:hypothetical protein